MDEQRHMTDEKLEALLDEALAPVEPVPELTERIVAASRPTPARRDRAVVARIGDGLPALAAAAVIALVMVGAWTMFEMRAGSGIGAGAEARPSTSLAAIERELSALDRAAADDPARVDEQIELLELQLELARTDPVWPGAADPLEEAGAQARMHSFVNDPMWQF